MLKREVLSRCVVFVLCACFVGAAASVLPGGVRAKAMSDAEFVELCEKGTAEQVKQALKDGATPDAHVALEEPPWRMTALMTAARNDNLPAVRALLEAGADVGNRREGEIIQGTPLMEAAKGGSEAVVRALLAAGADADAETEVGSVTALHLAVVRNNPDVGVVRALLEAGADPNKPDDGDTTALMYAATDSGAAVVRALLDAGANPRLKDLDGLNALGRAHQSSSPDKDEVIRLLRDALRGDGKRPAAKKKR